VIKGRVKDAAGLPVEGALVYFGNQIRMRGDEPFKPFLESRIKDGVRTDFNGGFTIEGKEREVTVWHPEHSPVTVPVAEAGNIVLPQRGGIEGRLLDVNGQPLSGVEVVLDRVRKTKTDPDGGFLFERVEAGVRGLRLPGEGKRYVGVQVPPGETVQARIGGFIPEVALEIFANGEPFTESLNGGLVGLDRVFSFHSIKGSGDRLTVSEVIPGNYLLLTRSGRLARVKVDGPRAEADLGRADLTVHAKEGTRVYVIPAGVHELIPLMGGRVSSQRVPASGKVLISPLPRGRYAVGIDRRGLFVEVEVTGPGAEVTLK
jgi:hypothetical protein